MPAVLLVACSEPSDRADELSSADKPEEVGNVADTNADGDEPVAEAEPVLPAPASLVGEYRVAGIDGEPLDASYGIALSIGENEIRFENCQLVGWSYVYSDGKLTTSHLYEPGRPLSDEADAVPCAAPLSSYEAMMVVAIDEAVRAGRTPTNGIELSGNGHSVTLFTQ